MNEPTKIQVSPNRRKHGFIIAGLIFAGLLVLYLLIYFLYLKQVVIYEPISIKISGLSIYDAKTIEVYSISPLDKKQVIPFDDSKNKWTGYYSFSKSIYLRIPEPVIEKIEQILIKVGNKEFTPTINEMPLIGKTGLIREHKFPSYVCSEKSWLKITFSMLHWRSFWRLMIILSLACACLFIFFIRRGKRTKKIATRKFFHFVLISLIVLALLFLIELISFYKNKKSGDSLPFFINTNEQPKSDYCEIDPLIGWKVPNKTLEEHGYLIKNNMIVLESAADTCDNKYNILITGGSTSDIYLGTGDWPVILQRKLNDNGYCADIYVGALAGYNSGQEFLKLVRDGLPVKPDIHISYSGANERKDLASYTSTYLQEIFNKITYNNKQSLFLPNTYKILNSFFPKNKPEIMILPRNPEISTFEFYKKNMELMNGIAVYNNYSFIGILQPLKKGEPIHFTDKIKQNKERLYLETVREFYPNAKNYAVEKSYIYDFTGIFDTVKENVFGDYCHVYPQYQYIIANGIYKLLTENGYITKVPSQIPIPPKKSN